MSHYFSVQMQGKVPSKAIDVEKPLRALSVVDLMPQAVARFAFASDEVRKVVESDVLEEGVHIFAAAMTYHRKKIEAFMGLGLMGKAVSEYASFLSYQKQFTDFASSVHLGLNPDGRNLCWDTGDRNLAGFERRLRDHMQGLDIEVSDSDFFHWVINLQRQQGILNGLSGENARARRDYAHEQGWHDIAVRIDRTQKDEQAELEDASTRFVIAGTHYAHVSPFKTLDWANEALFLAVKSEDESRLEEIVARYRERQSTLDGDYLDSQYSPGWKRNAPTTYSDRPHEVVMAARNATPLLVKVIATGSSHMKGPGCNPFLWSNQDPDKVEETVELLARETPVKTEDLLAFRERQSSRIVDKARFDRLLEVAGINPN